MPPLSAFEIPPPLLEPIPPPLSSPPSPLHAESPTLSSAPLGTSPLLPPPSEMVPASSPIFMPRLAPNQPLSSPPSTITLLPPAAPNPPLSNPSSTINLLPPPAPLSSPALVPQPLPFSFPSAPVHFPPSVPVPPAITSPPTVPAPLPCPLAQVSQPPPFPFPSTPVNFPSLAPASPGFPPKSLQVTSSPPVNSPAPPLRMPFPEPPHWSSAAPPTSPLEPPLWSSLPVAVEVNKPSGFNMSRAAIVGLVTGGAILLAFILGLLYIRRNRNRREKKHDDIKEIPNIGSKGSHVIQVEPHQNDPIRQPTISHESSKDSSSANSVSENAIQNHAPITVFGSGNHNFTYDELVVATNGFSEDKLLGQGGFGNVYKGALPNGKEIAVKQLKTGSQQGEREFQAEVETITRVHHKHLVELVGYCINGTERLLVYEFVPNNTLEFHLHEDNVKYNPEKGKPVMEWTTRMKIAIGSAKGLAYLHEDCNPAVIHRDIKASNILLDFGFEVKVSDFGMAKLFPNTDSCITHITTRVVGTFGYLAPEYASSGKLTDKSDV
ncbi:hypothetical protein L6164_024161 [Bauhinia variegata]|uniref:Uncharacterized protein n=1 Tax=Bauhinia variegata TaxID=167791 RepID=A0ACB9LXI5_BAUVA|nr:hypothetical protein L6164_024161 [Bauhinia variegata]